MPGHGEVAELGVDLLEEWPGLDGVAADGDVAVVAVDRQEPVQQVSGLPWILGMVVARLVVTLGADLLDGVHVEDRHIDGSVAGNTVGALLLLCLARQVLEMVALAKSLQYLFVTVPAGSGDVSEVDRAVLLGSCEVAAVCAVLAADLGVSPVAVHAGYCLLCVDGRGPALKVVV